MTDLLANEDLRRHEFPVTAHRIFLAHGGDCPLPRRVAEAVAKYAHDSSTGDQEKFVYPGLLDDGRKLGARLMNCKPDEVAFVGPTSLGLSLLASGLLGVTPSQAVGRFCGDVLQPRSEDGRRPCDFRCPILQARTAG